MYSETAQLRSSLSSTATNSQGGSPISLGPPTTGVSVDGHPHSPQSHRRPKSWSATPSEEVDEP